MTQPRGSLPPQGVPVAKPLPLASPLPSPSAVLPKAKPIAGPTLPPMPMARPAVPLPTPQAPMPVVGNLVTSASSQRTGRVAKKKNSPLPIVVAAIVGLLLVGAGAGATVWLSSSPAQPKKLAKAKKIRPADHPTAVAEAPAPVVPVPAAPTPSPAANRLANLPVAPSTPTLEAPTGGEDKSTFQFKPARRRRSKSAARACSRDSRPGSIPPGAAAAPVAGSFQLAGLKEDEAFQQAIVALYESQKLLVKKEYPALRKLFADRFAREQDAALRQGLGGDYDAMLLWLTEHPDVREELFTAIRPDKDKVPDVLGIFNELRKQFPDKIVPYANLAIATSVVWDDPRAGIYNYEHHARRCKANMPANLFAAVENFKYFVAAESVMQGRIQHVPWEFLVHVVNHRTPEPERVWAVQNFVGKRVMYGKCYSDVPYDMEMLKSGSETAKLNGKDYSLPNILTFGGVCAMQADFASRVGKSMGVSAEYVRGEAAGGELHAWVMWVELKQATPTGLVFSLESHGRYRGDKYYVGHLNDPQTGMEITDRDLELRLQTVGLDTVAKRHAALVMAAFPALRDRAQLDAAKQLALLSQVIGYSPGCEEAWFATARLFREVSGEKQHAKQYGVVLDRLFATFARVPDFTWKVFDDLAAYQAEPKPQVAMYQRLVTLYEMAERPDLACEARLKLTDILVEQEKPLDAVEGLALSIKKFPGEGRYVPRMLDRIDTLCSGVKGADQKLAQFYLEILPLVPQMRGSDPSPFALQMFERGVGVFTRLGQPQLAQAAQAELDKIKSGNGRKATN